MAGRMVFDPVVFHQVLSVVYYASGTGNIELELMKVLVQLEKGPSITNIVVGFEPL